MTESGVIPRPEERSAYTRVIDVVEDIRGAPLTIGVNYDTVTIGTFGKVLWAFPLSQMEDLGHVLIAAVWEAGRNAERMSNESDGDGGPT